MTKRISSDTASDLLDQAIWGRRLKVDLFEEITIDRPLPPQARDPIQVYASHFGRHACASAFRSSPKGLTNVAPGERLHVLRRDDGLERVLLVSFFKLELLQRLSNGRFTKKSKVQTEYKYKLIVLQTGAYEDAISKGELKFYGHEQITDYPSWLDYMERITPSQDRKFASHFTNNGVTREKSIDQRLLLLHGAINASCKILGARDPDRELNKFARACTPPQCKIRFRLWFYLYIDYGHKWVLLPPHLAELRYEGGQSSYLEYLDAQRSLFAAQQQTIRISLTELQNRISLHKALGGGWTATQESR